MNLIEYDAMAIGNHEFDNGVAGLAPFAQNLSFPLLACNINLNNTPTLEDFVNKSMVVTVQGVRIGIVGYTTVKTPFISHPETVTFMDELDPIQAEVDKLVSQGINIIIALGHSGYQVDLNLANRLRDVDIIVGGHTNTFLYTGKEPSNEKAEGLYPTVRETMYGGHKVLVVQDYCFGKYLGELHVTFDDKGHVTSWSGNPILLDKTIEKDQETEDRIAEYLPKLTEMKMNVIGETYVDLLADRIQCRTTECNLGNLITDAIVYENMNQSDPDSWTDVAIAVVNSGSFRSSILKGNITMEKVIFVQPFRNTLEIIEVLGQTLLNVLEFAASKWSDKPSTTFGGFLQVSGLQITYDISRPIGKRVVEVLAVCTKCRVPKLEPLEPKKIYKILISEYISNGGEGYSMLPSAIISRQPVGEVDTEVILKYIETHSPITTGLQSRIRHLKDIKNPNFCGGVGTTTPSFVTTLVIPLIYIWLNSLFH
jgi:2',3'-cyclic-nucleotide 2'-phosphodiesterase (5'-nucleotidase family)